MNTESQDTNVVEETQDEGATENSAAEADTESTAESAEEQSGAENQPEDGQDNPDTDDSGADEPFLAVKYNKNEIPLTREKAQEWAQKGMHYSDKLEYLAAIKGTTVSEMLKKEINDIDDNERRRLTEQFGDDSETVEKMMKLFHEENQAKYDKAIADRKLEEEQTEQNRIQKLGDEFIELQKEFPELTTVKDIPSTVIKDARTMSLEHAYLKYLHSEHQKAEAARQKQEAAEKESSGSLSSEKQETDTGFDNFAKGVWG